MVMCINFIGEIISKTVKVGVIVFPGSNCDRDMFHVLTDVFHLNTQYFWHEKGLPDNIDAVVLPGGFSYGDRLRAGVIACLLYTSPSPRDKRQSRMPSSA